MNAARLRSNLEEVKQRMAAAATRAGRDPGSVRLVAVTKQCPAQWLPELLKLGVNELGENYPQQLWQKAEAMAGTTARWHLIGHLQTNKLKRTLGLLASVQSVDSLRLLAAIDAQLRQQNSPGLEQVYLQVNASREAAKHGFEEAQLLELGDQLGQYSGVPIAGLMTMAAYEDDPDAARAAFARLRELRDALSGRTGLALAELSMGMSHDFEGAIEEGATVVRIGSLMFEGVGA